MEFGRTSARTTVPRPLPRGMGRDMRLFCHKTKLSPPLYYLPRAPPPFPCKSPLLSNKPHSLLALAALQNYLTIMASNEDLGESVDFDFFETPRSPVKDLSDTDNKRKNDGNSTFSLPPRGATPVFNTSKNNVTVKSTTPVSDISKSNVSVKNEKHDFTELSSESSSDYSSDSESISSNSVSKATDKSKSSSSTKSSSSISSKSTVSSLSSDKDVPVLNKNVKKEKDQVDSFSSDLSDNDMRPSNPTAIPSKQRTLDSDQESVSSEEEKHNRTSKKKDVSQCDDNDVFKRRVKISKKNKSQAWGEKIDMPKGSVIDRPKTAKGRVRIPTDRSVTVKPESEMLSDSDITDVSPMESPRDNKERKAIKSREGSGINAAGDGRYVTDLELDDPDRLANFDLSILMKAVGELEKQKRLKTNTRRVMFAPISVNRGERGNYTFDDNQTREIERENNRLLKEIVRQVNSREQTRGCPRQFTTNKLTPSAVNREREIRRIEMENLAILKRLKKVKPTKTISRENQLKQYESTMLHGVPMAALHPIPRVGRRSAYDDSASSMSSFTSGVSSVRSQSSRYSSRPGSAVRRPTSAKRYTTDRPDWSDRW
ncbi:Cilia- and flagella-associated protein 97 [Bulinus truncatus]|nr:Cilia- and flagella-associated protein 97 [Bulinus truncatus]